MKITLFIASLFTLLLSSCGTPLSLSTITAQPAPTQGEDAMTCSSADGG